MISCKTEFAAASCLEAHIAAAACREVSTVASQELTPRSRGQGGSGAINCLDTGEAAGEIWEEVAQPPYVKSQGMY